MMHINNKNDNSIEYSKISVLLSSKDKLILMLTKFILAISFLMATLMVVSHET